MMTFTELAPASDPPPEPFTDRLRLTVAAYLARFKGSSREHTESDLRCYLSWCAERGLDPLAARRPHLELYIRWMQEIRRFKPSTVSRRFSVVAGFYLTCVIDGLMPHSPAGFVLAEPGPGHAQRPAGCRVRDPVLIPLGGDQGSHRYRPVASLTHYAEDRIMPAWRINAQRARGSAPR
jgi:hypothetical protein